MTLLLVRHAVALHRRDWTKRDELRPLSAKGERQAKALVDVLAPYDIARICTSPYLRCAQTVEPLAAALGLAVEPLDELAEGRDDDAAGLVPGLGTGTVVFCSHGDVIPALLSNLAPHAFRGREELPIGKGSTWVVEPGGEDAIYLAPPS
jgi:8-oxo-dGTP diphosphatase